MATVSWLIRGERSEQTIITAPGAGAEAAAAAERLDLALNRFAGPMPTWYRLVQRTGYWWYPLCMLVCAVVLVAIPGGTTSGRVVAGLGLGVLVAPLSGAAMTSVARAVTRGRSNTTPENITKKLRGVARRGYDTFHETVDIVLEHDPSQEDRLHELLWRATKLSDSVLAEIESLIAEVAPDVAAARKAELKASIARWEEVRKKWDS